LIEMGRKDAMARKEEIMAFLNDQPLMEAASEEP